MCTGYWETCKCDDCKKVAELYEELDWFKDDEEERKEIESKIENMGYFI